MSSQLGGEGRTYPLLYAITALGSVVVSRYPIQSWSPCTRDFHRCTLCFGLTRWLGARTYPFSGRQRKSTSLNHHKREDPLRHKGTEVAPDSLTSLFPGSYRFIVYSLSFNIPPSSYHKPSTSKDSRRPRGSASSQPRSSTSVSHPFILQDCQWILDCESRQNTPSSMLDT
ncbi:hypothetical protein VUR80DRAFT_54 [Thermomyces stellatus]